jgi:hypothetical protein
MGDVGNKDQCRQAVFEGRFCGFGLFGRVTQVP